MSTASKARAFLQDVSGGSTAFALSLIMGGFMVGGLALDVAYAYKSRNELQIAADAAAHAALYLRQENTSSTAKSKAVDVAHRILPVAGYGQVLSPQDIEYGVWDYAAQTFSANPNSTEAVLVSTKRFESQGNAVQTFMLHFLGIDTFDVRADSVFITHYPTCLTQGFAAHGVVDVQSNNTFYSGFCVHSNNLVTMQQNNKFEAGVIISMPDSNDVSAGSGNDGLKEALQDYSYRLRILDRMDEIWTSLQTGGAHLPDYIVSSAPIHVETNTIIGTNSVGLSVTSAGADLLEGRVYIINCTGPALTISNDVLVKDVVIVTTCDLRFNAGSAVENAILMTKSTSNDSVASASGFRLGRNDGCAADGGAQILTYGSVLIPAGLEVYGGQIIAQGDINFAANADGVEGVSFIAGGAIDGTSNANIRFCKTGMERNFELPFFRLAG